MDTRHTDSIDQALTPERIEALTARAHRMRDEYIAAATRRVMGALRRRLAGVRDALGGRLAGSH